MPGVRRPLLGADGQRTCGTSTSSGSPSATGSWPSCGRAGIGAGIHYPYPVHLTGAYAHLGLGPGTAPVAEAAAGEILSLPMYPHLTEDQQDRVVEVLADAVAGGRS